MGCSHMGSAPSGLCRAGLESATVPVGKQGEQGWPSPLGEAWRLFLLWWIQSTIKPLSLRPLAPSSWEQNSAGYSGAAESIRGCCRAAPVSLHCSGSPVPISSPGMSPWCPTAELPPGCCCSWGGLNPRHEIPVTGSLHEQVSVVSHEAFLFVKWRPGGGWIPSSRASSSPWLFPGHGCVFCAELCSLPSSVGVQIPAFCTPFNQRKPKGLAAGLLFLPGLFLASRLG